MISPTQTNWIRKKRTDLKISQYKMARALNITSQKLSAWELEKEEPSHIDEKNIHAFFENHNHFFQKNGISTKKKTFKRNGNHQNSKSNNIDQELLEKFYSSKARPKIIVNEDLKAVMLFSGIGGMSLGFKNAGYNIVAHVENNDSANKIYNRNFPESQLLGTDIQKISEDELKKIKREHGEIAVVAGGPPCQGFSLAGKRNAFDPRNELFKDFARFAKSLQPKAIVLENVKMLLTMKTKDGGLVSDYLIKEFGDAGYRVTYQIVNASNYGVPQSRERVIFLGIRNDVEKRHKFTFPEPTHGDAREDLFNSKIKLYKTFREATKDLESLESGEKSSEDPWHFAIVHPDHVIEMLKDVPEGKSAHDNADKKLRPSSGYNTTYKRIRWNEPSSTISTNFSMISGSRNVHPKNTRALTIREAMRCQTFPDYFELLGSLGEIRKGIGNAVPPSLAQHFAEHIKKEFLNGKNILPSS